MHILPTRYARILERCATTEQNNQAHAARLLPSIAHCPRYCVTQRAQKRVLVTPAAVLSRRSSRRRAPRFHACVHVTVLPTRSRCRLCVCVCPEAHTGRWVACVSEPFASGSFVLVLNPSGTLRSRQSADSSFRARENTRPHTGGRFPCAVVGCENRDEENRERVCVCYVIVLMCVSV